MDIHCYLQNLGGTNKLLVASDDLILVTNDEEWRDIETGVLDVSIELPSTSHSPLVQSPSSVLWYLSVDTGAPYG